MPLRTRDPQTLAEPPPKVPPNSLPRPLELECRVLASSRPLTRKVQESEL